MAIQLDTPMGPGFFIFFRKEVERVGRVVGGGLRRLTPIVMPEPQRKRDDLEIALALLEADQWL